MRFASPVPLAVLKKPMSSETWASAFVLALRPGPSAWLLLDRYAQVLRRDGELSEGRVRQRTVGGEDAHVDLGRKGASVCGVAGDNPDFERNLQRDGRNERDDAAVRGWVIHMECEVEAETVAAGRDRERGLRRDGLTDNRKMVRLIDAVADRQGRRGKHGCDGCGRTCGGIVGG